MKFTEITFHQLFATGQYENQRLEAKATLEEGDTLCEAFKEAKSKINEAFKYINPQFRFDPSIMSPPQTATMNGVPMFQPQPLQSIDRRAIDEMEIKIDNAESLAELEGYYLEATNMGLGKHYNYKLKKILNGTIQ